MPCAVQPSPRSPEPAIVQWVWQNAQWTRAATTGPSLRNGQPIAYDLTRGKVVLFGGFRSGQDFSDTWEWDGTRWTQITPQ